MDAVIDNWEKVVNDDLDLPADLRRILDLFTDGDVAFRQDNRRGHRPTRSETRAE